ncbi:28S ribosomal protein S7, mitochondrial-like [Homarus americanus]|uniref:28S ribosomal protein S7-like n=1 Tax=Homarus americanus TaxID=6706 RepID=A0A8J5J7Q0_HOMAM|nr:28S ribosomal protein S7, mitochondrial-like [Homarus americanus]KAG7153736.1 28S ribosomal protein S7-like [Homarus americanus]
MSGGRRLAVGLSQCWLSLNTQVLLSRANRQSAVILRNYSQYPPTFVKPIYQPAQQKDLIETGEVKNLEFTPVRAAYNSHTSSVFHDPLLRKFINHVMKTGRKDLARNLVEQTFETIKRIQLQKFNEAETEEEKANIECNPLVIFHQAVENGRPVLQLIPIKRGGIKYQVPVPITEKRSHFISMRWYKQAGKEKERTVHFPEKLARELLAGAKNEGRVVKQKHDLHRQCEANRAYAHYRWS